jgi:hypothetical protein
MLPARKRGQFSEEKGEVPTTAAFDRRRTLGGATAHSGVPHDVRFSSPLYSQAEAARYVDMPATTLRDWAHSTRGHAGRPMVTSLQPAGSRHPTVPFIGLAEAMFLSALRRAGVPMLQIRPALAMVEERVRRFPRCCHGCALANASTMWPKTSTFRRTRSLR